MTTFKTLLSCTILLAVKHVVAAPVPILIDDFEKRATAAPWTLSNGAEFPGAYGSLKLSTGYTGQGMQLGYAIGCIDANTCGHYVAASLALPKPLAKPVGASLGFWVKWPAPIKMGVRLVDETNQTFQYQVTRPLENQQPKSWAYLKVPLVDVDSGHWGGANDGVFHGGIKALSLLAADPYLLPTAGAVVVDDMSLINNPSPFQLDPNQLSIIPAPVGSTHLAPRLGISMAATSGNDPSLAIAKKAGFSFARIDLLWADVEQNGGYNFARYDNVLAGLENQGMGALFILDYTHPDHGGVGCQYADGQPVPCPPQSDAEIAAFANYARAAATHFKGHPVRFEIWNEPNLEAFWYSPPYPGDYALLAKAASAAIHQANPAALVSTGGLSEMDFHYFSSMFNEGAAQTVNAIAIHPYRHRQPPESANAEILTLKDVMQTNFNLTLPLWDSEWGYSSAIAYPPAADGVVNGALPANRNRQAVLAVRKILTDWMLALPISVWYDLRDDGVDRLNPEHNFGLIDSKNQDKPAIIAIRTLTNAVGASNFVGLADGLPAGLHAMKLTGSTNTRFIVWQSESGQTTQMNIAMRGQVSAVDMFGKVVALINCTPASGTTPALCPLKVNEATGPVYLTFK